MCYHLPKIFKAIIIIATIAPPSSSKALEYSECLGFTELDIFVSSKRSCSKYIYCNGESSFEGECLGGNFFNEAQGICDDPENVQCDIVEGDGVVSIFDETFQKSEGDKNVESLEGDSIEGDDTGFGGTVEVSSELEENIIHLSNAPKCDKANRGIRHIPHQDSCAAFFTCYNGIAIPMLCPKNSYFNPETEICDHKMPNKCKLPYSIRLNCRKGVYDY
uniref:Chitin-binding type-2 domain-containing protein n=1 Tax=Stomoxys calcitrans TaxID=35570 RepID=A0A1I8PQB5_STOCA